MNVRRANFPDGIDPASVARRVVDANAAAVAAVEAAIGPAAERAALIIAECTGKVVVAGSGTSGTVALRAAHLLSVAGAPAFYLPPADGLHGGLGAVSEGDVVLALSKGGGSDELNAFCERARARAGRLIVVTASPSSALASLADEVIVLTLPKGSDLGEVIATGSSLAAATVTDVLAELVRLTRGVAWETILHSHPSGAVGRDASETLTRLAGRAGEGERGA